MRYYKWMADGKPIYGVGEYAKPGEWQPRIGGTLEMCERGYHVCTAEQLSNWCGTELIEVEVDEVVKVGSDKVLCRTWREIRRFKWTREDMVQFADSCAAAAAAAYATATAAYDAAAAAYAAARDAAAATADAAAYDAAAAAYAAVAAAATADAAAAYAAVAYAAVAADAAAAAADAAAAASRAAYDAAAAAYAAERRRQKEWIEDRIGEKLT